MSPPPIVVLAIGIGCGANAQSSLPFTNSPPPIVDGAGTPAPRQYRAFEASNGTDILRHRGPSGITCLEVAGFARPLKDLRTLVFRNHALELQQKLILSGGVARRLDKEHLHARTWAMQQRDNLQDCRSISDSAEQLHCYEKAAVDQSKGLEPAIEGGWRLIRTVNPAGGPDAVSIIRSADIAENFPALRDTQSLERMKDTRSNPNTTSAGIEPSAQDRVIPVRSLTGGILSRRRLHILLLGMRGIPDVQGGVEKHAERLALALTKLGCNVEAVVRNDFVPKGTTSWNDIRIVRLWNSRTKGVEAFFHTLFGVLYAAWRRPDILHIHGIGPAIFAPLARVLGLRVVVTYHSLNYEHAKWGPFGRAVLRIGEWFGMAFSNGKIAVSEELVRRMNQAYGTRVNNIPNGIAKPEFVPTIDTLQAFGLSTKRYVLTVARIDEAKRLLDLIAAYASIPNPGFELALVGQADHMGPYARAVDEAARQTPGVMLLGRQTGRALAELYTHAGAFVLPSSHEGQPMAVLEAASYGLPVILSDIPAHRELAVPGARYFAVGDIAALERQLRSIFATPFLPRIRADDRLDIVAKHDWDDIARRTFAIYLAASS